MQASGQPCNAAWILVVELGKRSFCEAEPAAPRKTLTNADGGGLSPKPGVLGTELDVKEEETGSSGTRK